MHTTYIHTAYTTHIYTQHTHHTHHTHPDFLQVIWRPSCQCRNAPFAAHSGPPAPTVHLRGLSRASHPCPGASLESLRRPSSLALRWEMMQPTTVDLLVPLGMRQNSWGREASGRPPPTLEFLELLDGELYPGDGERAAFSASPHLFLALPLAWVTPLSPASAIWCWGCVSPGWGTPNPLG